MSDHIALIAGPDAGPGGRDHDGNVYAVATSAGAVLIDAGVGRSLDPLAAIATGDEFGLDPVAALLLTHAHLDHAGGARLVHDRFGAPVYASAETARRVSEADEDSIALPAARAAGMYRPDDHLAACPVANVVADGDVIAVGDTAFAVLETPGHAADHVAYLAEIDGRCVLFAGDLLFPGGTVALINTHDCSIQSLVRSLERLRDLEFDALLSGHLAPTLTGGPVARDTALAAIDALNLPRSIV